MARYNADRDVSPVLAAAAEWASGCLVEDGSLLVEGRRLWTLENARVLRRDFVERPILGAGGFNDKLREQLSDSGVEAAQLAAEMVWALLLFQTNVSSWKKRENVTEIWGWGGEAIPASPLLEDDSLAGIGSAGQGYNTYRWKELALLIDLVISIKQMDRAVREALLADPWRFGEWVQEQPREGYRQLPNLLRYLLFPDDYERISVADHKRRILMALGPDLMSSEGNDDLALDRALFELRSRISSERGTGDFDFYDEDLKERWVDPPTPAWLLTWNPRNWAWDTLAEERERCAAGGTVRHDWRSQSTKPAVGDRVFLMRTGERPRGIVARGSVVRPSFEDRHYNELKAEQGERTRFVEVQFDDVRQAEHDPIISPESLRDAAESQEWSPQGSGIEIRPAAARALEELWSQLPPVQVAVEATVAQRLPYTLDDALRGAFMERAELERILAVWASKLNIILQGAPGTGKTYLARRLAYALLGEVDPSRVETVQFHQSYGYEDFVQGYRPTTDGFELREGSFAAFCRRASADIDRPHVFIIDEINRGNLSKIFGEVMMLVERDKREPGFGVRLTYSRDDAPRFHVPRNVHVIGMMNTADRSISLVDYALRRRFAFFTLEPRFRSPAFSDWLIRAGVDPVIVAATVERMSALNEAIAKDTINLGRGFRVGHSFFVPAEGATVGEDWLAQVVETEIRPLLEEYWFEQPDRADEHCQRLLGV